MGLKLNCNNMSVMSKRNNGPTQWVLYWTLPVHVLICMEGLTILAAKSQAESSLFVLLYSIFY